MKLYMGMKPFLPNPHGRKRNENTTVKLGVDSAFFYLPDHSGYAVPERSTQ